jgi:hypothetical protein
LTNTPSLAWRRISVTCIQVSYEELRVSLKWRVNRLRAMGAAEISSRALQVLRSRLEQYGVGLAREAAPSRARGTTWLPVLPTSLNVATYVAEADRIIGGRFRVFGMDAAPLGFPPDWNRDPKTGARPPMTFGKSLDYRNERLVGDVKYLWEPNRHAELVTLAQAWHLSREQRYASACARLIDSWIDACPYPLGINWTSSLELALRLVNWSFAWHILGGETAVLFEGSAGQALRIRWLTCIRQHCHFIAGHLSRHSSANNHLLGELLGLFVASTTWPLWHESRRWHDCAHAEFKRQVLAQNASDGVNREQAIWYQQEVADMMLVAGLYARNGKCEFGAEYWNRWAAMLEFIAGIMDYAGHVPMFGDADDAVIARLDPARDFDPFRSLLACGAVLLKDAPLRDLFKAKARGLDDKSRWLLGDSAATEFAAQTPQKQTRAVPRRAFSEGGYYILGSDLERPREVRAVADAGPLGYLTIAAHGHADALAFTLSIDGDEMLIDPGTYTYYAGEQWRSYFRGTRAHNTVTVDGEDQSVSGGRFLWTKHATIKSTKFESGADLDRLSAEHDGYHRLADPVTHRRELAYSKAARVFRITDRLICKSRHHMEINWHFAPACEVVLMERQLRATRGEVTVELTWSEDLAARLARGEDSPPRGWFSRRLDVKEPCANLVLERDIDGTWEATCDLRILSPQR